MPAPSSRWSRDLLWLALAFGLILGFQLGSVPFDNPDEGRNVEIPREMVASGEWVTPRLNGINYFEKPPLVYWSIGAFLKFLGPGEWSMRASPALFALGGILLTYAAARRLHGREAGLMSAVVLGTSLLYFGVGRFLVLDMAVSVLMASTLFCFILGVLEPPGARRRWLFHGLYASAALATLAKGFIGFLVTGAVMFLWLLVFNQWKRLRPLHLPTGLLLFLAIAVPWHVLAGQRNDTWAHRYIYVEHFARFFTDYHGRVQPWHYFIGILIGGLFPWIAFLWPAVREAIRGGWASRGENATGWFYVTWAAFIFLFFSKSQSKLPAYILPIFPALAVIIGTWFAGLMRQPDGPARLRVPLRIFSFFAGLLAVALLVTVLRPGLVIKDPAQALALRNPAIVLAVVLLNGGVVIPALARVRGVRIAFIAVGVTMALFLGALTFAVPNIYKPGTRELALYVKSHAQPGDRVLHYHDFFHDFTFYAERTVGLVEAKGELELEEDPAAQARGILLKEAEFRALWDQPGRVFAVAKKKDVTELFADKAFHYQLLAQSPDHYLLSNKP